MSIHAMSWAWKQKCSPAEKLVLMALADHSDDKGRCWPGLSSVAEKTGYTRRTIISAVKRLSDSGVIKAEHRFREGIQTTNMYILNLEGGEAASPGGEQATLPGVKEIHPGGEIDCIGGVKEFHTEPSVKQPSVKTPKPMTGFDRFWEAYPKKTGKGAAEKAWGKIKKPAETVDLILEALEWQKASADWQKENGQFIPNPATYLNQRRWEDEKTENRSGHSTQVVL